LSQINNFTKIKEDVTGCSKNEYGYVLKGILANIEKKLLKYDRIKLRT
jgi:hypothetical protein